MTTSVYSCTPSVSLVSSKENAPEEPTRRVTSPFSLSSWIDAPESVVPESAVVSVVTSPVGSCVKLTGSSRASYVSWPDAEAGA